MSIAHGIAGPFEGKRIADTIPPVIDFEIRFRWPKPAWCTIWF